MARVKRVHVQHGPFLNGTFTSSRYYINLTAPDDIQSLADLLSPDLIQQAFSLTFRRNHSAIKHAMSNNVLNMAVAQRLISQGVTDKKLDKQIRHQAARWVDISTVFEMLPHATNTVCPSTARKDALGIPMLDGALQSG